MTGAELLAEILQGDLSDFCRLALDGCVLLTAEEAEKVRLVISSTIYQPPGWTGPSVWWEPSAKEALALLIPAGDETTGQTRKEIGMTTTVDKQTEANVVATQAGAIRQLVDSGAYTADSIRDAVISGDLTGLKEKQHAA